jgi:tripartite-type tricarboxylate transporter receptor subunit TctC
MKRTLYGFLTATAIALGTFAATTTTAHAAYPEKPVKVIVGFAPGGTNDILARLISQKLQERLKQAFVVENKPGANSAIAAQFSAKAPPDGYTIFIASSGAMTVNPIFYKKLNYDPVKDFEPVALLGSFPLVVTARADFPASDMNGLPPIVKKSQYGALDHGVGASPFQLAAELYARESGVKVAHVPYKGSGPTIIGLLGGEVQLAFLDIGAVLSHIKGGKLKALAVTTANRSKSLPDVPTIAELGVRGYDVPIWTGLVVPRGTPAEATARLREALKEILSDKEVVSKIESLGMESGNVDVKHFSKRVADDLVKWRDVAKFAKIKPE